MRIKRLIGLNGRMQRFEVAGTVFREKLASSVIEGVVCGAGVREQNVFNNLFGVVATFAALSHHPKTLAHIPKIRGTVDDGLLDLVVCYSFAEANVHGAALSDCVDEALWKVKLI